MKPDKIYVGIVDLGSGYATDVCLSPREGDYDEYIRKDALIEWLQQGFDWIKNPVISVQQIIDKLNTM